MEQIRNALQCRICLDSVSSNCHVSSCCGNLFHEDCAHRVRSTAKRNHQPSLCPTCRASHFCGAGNSLLKLGWMDDIYHQIATTFGEVASADRARVRKEPATSEPRNLMNSVENANPPIRPEFIATTEPAVCKVHSQFIPLRKEIHKKRMEVYYNAANDKYHRTLCNVKNQGWRSCVWKYCNIERKTDDSWQMVYLGRENGPDTRSSIEWRFNLKEVGLKVKKLKIAVPCVTFDSGAIKVTLISRSPNALANFTVSEDDDLRDVREARGWDDFVIRVELLRVRSEETCSQNAQLFRQFLPDATENVFRVIIDMCDSV